MKLITIGDSITHGQFTSINDSFPASLAKPYGEYLKEYLSCDYINYGRNGISFSSTSNVNGEYSLELVCPSFEKADIIVIACGTNDFGTNVKLDDFSNAVKKVFLCIKRNNPGSKIIILTPLHRFNDHSNDIQVSLSQYSSLLKEETKEFGFLLIDGFDFPVNPNREEDRKRYSLDGTHLNEKGQRLLAEFIISKGVLQ